MALVACPDCGTQVSDQAPACPKCARPLRAQQPAPSAPKKGMSGCAISAIVVGVLFILVFIIGVVVLRSASRKYVAASKMTEARNSLGEISLDVRAAYERDRHLCPSSTAPVPADRTQVSGRKYQTDRSEWQKDAPSAGFACLKFNLEQPQYFQYEYQATATTFVARAHGDLNGDGIFSTFEISGRIEGGVLHVDPTMVETDPEE